VSIYSFWDWKLMFSNKYLPFMKSLTYALKVQVSMTHTLTYVSHLPFANVIFHVVTIFENILLWEVQLQIKNTLWIQLMVEIRWYGQKTLLSNLVKRSHPDIDFIIKCTKFAYLWSLILNVKRYIYKYLKGLTNQCPQGND
jgi:hypothetical protein